MSEVICDQILDEALSHVYKRLKEDSHNSDIWALSLYWDNRKEDIRTKLLSGNYNLSPVRVCRGGDEKYYTRWTAQDAVVLKALTLVLSTIIREDVGDDCYHLKGCGGLKGAIKKAVEYIPQYNYALKADVANFYASMDHEILLDQCKELIQDKRIITILHQYMNRVEVLNGEYNLIEIGISKGCPLSPLMGALILKSLDKIVSRECFYVRYMDDWLIMTKTRGQLRRLVKAMHNIMYKLKFKLALDKTYIGRIQNGFDFLGYRFNEKGIIGLAAKTVKNFMEKTAKLYEQCATDHRIRCYINKWIGWVVAAIA